MNEKINKIFSALDKKYGWLGWWPSTPPDKEYPEYHKSKNYKYSEYEKFEIAIGAILTQNTAWSNVVKALYNLKKLKCSSPEKMLEIEETKILEAIKPSGYYNQKLKKMRYLCEFLIKNNWRDLEKLDISELRKRLLDIWGIGKETADSIILYVFNKPIFVVDAYTRRILQRCEIIDAKKDYDEIRILIEKNIPKKVNLYKNYHAAIVEHCKYNCKIKPLCEHCIIKNYCKLN
ncbi:MAG TPA: endonuclease [bacterium]|nr:endonuclease [bacterium]